MIWQCRDPWRQIWPFWVRLGVILGLVVAFLRQSHSVAKGVLDHGAILSYLEAILGPSWGHLGAILGPSWGLSGPSWGHLGVIYNTARVLPLLTRKVSLTVDESLDTNLNDDRARMEKRRVKIEMDGPRKVAQDRR